MAIPGSIVAAGKLVTPGGAPGPVGPTAVSSDPGNLAVLGSDNLILVPQSSIWSARLRSFNAIGNPNFEINQRLPGTALSIPAGNLGTFLLDRWRVGKIGATAVLSANQQSVIRTAPGTNFAITQNGASFTVTTPQASLAAGDYLNLYQIIEGPSARELINDVTSITLAVSCSFNLTFAVVLRDSTNAWSYVHLCNYTGAGAIQWFTIPNIPIFPTSGSFPLTPGSIAYTFTICLAAGSTSIAPSADTWVSGNFVGAAGITNFMATSGGVFNLWFVQHEPGPLCTTPIDKPFAQNYDECLRYYQKSYGYGVAPGAANNAQGAINSTMGANVAPSIYTPFKKVMAKVPTVIGYSPNTGAANVVRDVGGGVDRAISGNITLGDSGFSGFTLSATPAAVWQVQYHYTADTGW
jgi:hypothetical protein